MDIYVYICRQKESTPTKANNPFHEPNSPPLFVASNVFLYNQINHHFSCFFIIPFEVTPHAFSTN